MAGFKRPSKPSPKTSMERKYSMDQPRPRKSTVEEPLIPNISTTYDDDGSFLMEKRTHSEIGQKLNPIREVEDGQSQNLNNFTYDADDPYKVSSNEAK